MIFENYFVDSILLCDYLFIFTNFQSFEIVVYIESILNGPKNWKLCCPAFFTHTHVHHACSKVCIGFSRICSYAIVIVYQENTPALKKIYCNCTIVICKNSIASAIYTTLCTRLGHAQVSNMLSVLWQWKVSCNIRNFRKSVKQRPKRNIIYIITGSKDVRQVKNELL